MNQYLKLLAVATAGGVGVVGASMLTIDGVKSPQMKIVNPTGVLAKADPWCQAKVREVGPNPQCVLGKALLGNSKTESSGWFCNGAWMPASVQTCLNDAAKKEADIKEASQ